MISQLPPLPREQQLELCKRAQAGDRAARDRLILTSMRMVTYRAKRYLKHTPGIDVDDLLQDGVLGLMAAIDSFDVSYGTSFATYAVPSIDNHLRAAVYKHRDMKRGDMDRGWRVMKRYNEQVAAGLERDAALAAVADMLRMRVRTVTELLDNFKRPVTLSLDAPISKDQSQPLVSLIADTDAISAEDTLASRAMNDNVRRTLARFRRKLTPRDQEILELRILADAEDAQTLLEIAARYGVSKERVRQLEKNLYGRLRQMLSCS